MRIIQLTTKRDGSETLLVNCDHIVTVESLPRAGSGSQVTISNRTVVKCVETPDLVFGLITARDQQQPARPTAQQPAPQQAPQPVYQQQAPPPQPVYQQPAPQPAPQPVYQQPAPQPAPQPQIIRRGQQ